jgi:dihydroorotase
MSTSRFSKTHGSSKRSNQMRHAGFSCLLLRCASSAAAQPDYDLLLKGGHVIDGRNGINAVRDVAIKDGKIAAVAADIPAARAVKTVNATGLYVTPGLIDIHVHMFPGTADRYSAGALSVPPDGFTLRSCVTTVADAGSSGWRNFSDFKTRIIDQSKTRVTAFLNIVGSGMAGIAEQNIADMDAKATADMVRKHKGVIVGIKNAHFAGPEWTPYERTAEAGRLANVPIMVDFDGPATRSLAELFAKYYRPGDIYTHTYGGSNGEQDATTKGPSQALLESRKRGIFFDVGHGGSSFRWAVAVPFMKAGFVPDSISTDLHVGSMNAGMKDMLNVMGKFVAMGMSLDDVIQRSTWNPAKQIKLEQLGNLSAGAPADVAVLRIEKGAVGFVDSRGARVDGTTKLVCEMTVRNGSVVYDLNGMSRDRWDPSAPDGGPGDPRWDGITPMRRPARSPSR